MYSTLCLECYHGMTLHDTVCARCHNEVRSPFSLVRALTDIHMQTVHRTSNIATTPQTAYAGEIMPELYDIINSITQIEEMEILRSLGSPCFVMRVSKTGQCFHFPHTLTPDGLAYADDTDSRSREHFSPAPGFRTSKTSRQLGKLVGRTRRINDHRLGSR